MLIFFKIFFFNVHHFLKVFIASVLYFVSLIMKHVGSSLPDQGQTHALCTGWPGRSPSLTFLEFPFNLTKSQVHEAISPNVVSF